jgi:hypothetical protein
MNTLCPIDARPLSPPTAGRPPTFCSVACRRVAEHELRRIDRRLAGLEDERDRLELAIATGDPHYPAVIKTHQRERDAVDAAITKATERQRDLFERISNEGEQQ